MLQSTRLAAHFYDEAYGPGQQHQHYGWLYRLFWRWATHREDIVLSLLPPGDRLLDIGCGDGYLIWRAASKFRRAVGCDVSMLRLSKGRGATRPVRASLVGSNVDFGLPFLDELFDAVTAVALLAHVFDVHHCVREMRRVLKPGGICIVQVPNLAYLPRRIALLFGKQPWSSSGYGWDGGQLHSFTLGSLNGLLVSEGFEIEQVTGSGFLPALRSPRRSLLSGDLIVIARRRK